jgi:hypothetical protein
MVFTPERRVTVVTDHIDSSYAAGACIDVTVKFSVRFAQNGLIC